MKVNNFKQRHIVGPSGMSVYLETPIIVGTTAATPIGWSFTQELTIEGSNRSIGNMGLKFIIAGDNQLLFAVQYARGITFKGISFEGKNSFGVAAQDLDDRMFESNYLSLTEDIRDNRYSPHAGVVIDPFSNQVLEANRYPGLDAYYNAGDITGGSSRVKFEDCNFQWFIVGLGVSMAGDALNAEEIDTFSCTFTASKVGIAYGQSQTRANTVKDCRMAGLHTGITTTDYGLGQGSMPNISGGDWIQMYQLIESSSSRGGFLIKNLYAEDFLAIGHDTGGSKPIQMTFVGCDFHFAGGFTAPEYTWKSVSPVTFMGCNFQHGGTFPFQFYGADRDITFSPITFDNCNFFNLLENNTGIHHEFIVSNGEIVAGINNQTLNRLLFKNTRVFKSGGKSVTLDSTQITTPTISSMNGKMVIPGSSIVSAGNVYRISDLPPPSIGHVISSPSHVAGSGTGTFTVVAPNRFKVGDAVKVATGQTWPLGPTDNFAHLYLGYVSAVTDTTVTLSGVPYSVPANFAVGYTVFEVTWIPEFHEVTTATVTSGSPILTEVSPNPTTIWSVGDRISGTGIPPGSYVTAVTSTTITIIANATASNTGVGLYDARYYKVLDETATNTQGANAHILRYWGIGSPEDIVTAPKGSIYHRLDEGEGAAALYIKESTSGDTGWIAQGSSAEANNVTVTSSGASGYVEQENISGRLVTVLTGTTISPDFTKEYYRIELTGNTTISAITLPDNVNIYKKFQLEVINNGDNFTLIGPSNGLQYPEGDLIPPLGTSTITFEWKNGAVYYYIDWMDQVIRSMSFNMAHRADASGTTVQTNNYSQPTWGIAIMSPTADQLVNWYEVRWEVPVNFSPNEQIVLEDFKMLLGGTDANAHTYRIGIEVVKPGFARAEPNVITKYISVPIAGLVGGTVNESIKIAAPITLTDWRDDIEPGDTVWMRIERDGDSDASTVLSYSQNVAISYTVIERKRR
jgi:hypothetical protein